MDRTKKITKYLLLIVLVIFICIIAGVIYLYNEIFPKAEPINLPQIESVVSVALSYNTSDATLPISNENFENLLEYISTAKPTRRDASSDYPTEKSYYCIAVQTFEREYRYFIYKDGGYYIETPYEGVYETEAELFNSILSYYEETTTTPGIFGEDVNVNSIEKVTIKSGETGESVDITDPKDIEYITNNINSFDYAKGEKVNGDGWSYMLRWYNSDGEIIKEISLLGSDTIIFDGYYYRNISDGAIDISFFAEQLTNN